MLSIQALESALPLTERLANKGLVVEPVPGTPLEALVQASRGTASLLTAPAPAPGESPVVALDLPFIATMANMTDDVTKINPHNVAMDDIAAVVIPAVTNHLNFARTVVNPAVEDLVERVTRAMASITPATLSGAEVIVEEVPAPLLNASFDAMVQTASQVVYNPPAMDLRMPDATISEIREYMKTGTSSIDSAVDEWLTQGGDTWLIELWEGVFQIKPRAPGEKRFSFTDWVMDKECGVDYALAIYLLARNLFDNVPDGVTMTLAAYQNTMANYRDQAASQLCRELERLDRNSKNGQLITALTGMKVTVCADVYRKWIEAGGDNDVLFGNALQTTPVINVDQINANAIALKKAWDEYCTVVSVRERNERFYRTKELLLSSFIEQMKEVVEEGAENGVNAEGVDTAIRLFREELNKIIEQELDCLYTLALKLVCKSRFPEHAAFDILSGINLAKKKNPALTTREAALISAFEYTCDWIASLFQVRA